MNRGHFWILPGSIVVLLALVWGGVSVEAQLSSGALHGSVLSNTGDRLAGAVVELKGTAAPHRQIADSSGGFRFLGLDPGRYDLITSLDGFSTAERIGIEIRTARNTTVEVQLTQAIHEVLSVTSESPLLDERQLSPGTAVSRLELETIPTARDPWAVLSQTPGVFIGQVNVGGSESGQQAAFRGLGIPVEENDWVLDGVQVTDMASTGMSSTYYDFDQVEEILITTGGDDITRNSGGAAVNLVTRRGTNEFRGSARFLRTDGDGYFGLFEQADSGFDESKLGPGQEDFVPNRIDRIEEVGFEAGGPIWRNRIWAWGSWAKHDISRVAGSGQEDRTFLENVAIKLNAQLAQANSFVGSFNNGDKKKFGRYAQPSWHPSATYNQRGPTGVTKVEDSHVFSSSLFLSAQYSFVDGGYSLSAQGGCGRDRPTVPDPGGEANVDVNDFQTNNDCGYRRQPTDEWRLTGSYFFGGLGASHQLTFGGRARESGFESTWALPGRDLFHIHGAVAGVQDTDLLESLGLPPSRVEEAHLVEAQRSGVEIIAGNYESLWLQDTVTWGRWTANVGLRFDTQYGRNGGGTLPANAAFPELLPSVALEGNDSDGLRWNSLLPRLGLTYALGVERQTLLRGSFAQFPDQLGIGDIARTNSAGGAYASIVFLDQPGGYEGFYDDGETWAALGDVEYDVETPSHNDPDMDPPLTREAILGVEHSFLPELVASLKLTWRNRDNLWDYSPLFRDNSTGLISTIPATEYIPDRLLTGTLPDGSPYSVPTWAADPDRWGYTGAELMTDGDREVSYFGTSIAVAKRLSNGWMMRGFVHYNFDETWQVPRSYFATNDPNRWLQDDHGSVIDGELFAAHGLLQSDWQWNLNGLYQVVPERRWGFNVATNITGRQGTPLAYSRSVAGLDGVGRDILVAEELGDFRTDDVVILDVRLEKEFAATGSLGLTLSLDGFNIFNDGSVLDRYTNMGAGNAEWVSEVVSPRVWRLGVRINWR